MLALVVAATSCASSGGGGAATEIGALEPVAADGEPLLLADVDGPAIVNLWATWCTPCRAELPALQAISQADPTVARVIGVNVGDEPTAIDRFLADLGVSFEQYVDPSGEVMSAMGIVGLPASFVVTAQGEIGAVHEGALDEDGFRQLVADAARVNP